jgi:hypothetical protein
VTVLLLVIASAALLVGPAGPAAAEIPVPATATPAATPTATPTTAPTGAAATPAPAATAPSFEATSRLTGSGPLSAWFGGTARRTYELTVTNNGTGPLDNPRVTVTGGKGSNPTGLIAQPEIGVVAPGQTIVFEVPVSFTAPTFGEYQVRATFDDPSGDVVTTASTSTYPYALIVVLWLLLQPLLLGLYKRRPGAGGSDDPLPTTPDAIAPAPAEPEAAPAPTPAPVPVPAPAQTEASTPAPAPQAPVVAPTASTAVETYRPVFGVRDLRTYLDPADASAPRAVNPRVVLGGLAPSAPAPDEPRPAHDAGAIAPPT